MKVPDTSRKSVKRRGLEAAPRMQRSHALRHAITTIASTNSSRMLIPSPVRSVWLLNLSRANGVSLDISCKEGWKRSTNFRGEFWNGSRPLFRPVHMRERSHQNSTLANSQVPDAVCPRALPWLVLSFLRVTSASPCHKADNMTALAVESWTWYAVTWVVVLMRMCVIGYLEFEFHCLR